MVIKYSRGIMPILSYTCPMCAKPVSVLPETGIFQVVTINPTRIHKDRVSEITCAECSTVFYTILPED